MWVQSGYLWQRQSVTHIYCVHLATPWNRCETQIAAEHMWVTWLSVSKASCDQHLFQSGYHKGYVCLTSICDKGYLWLTSDSKGYLWQRLSVTVTKAICDSHLCDVTAKAVCNSHLCDVTATAICDNGYLWPWLRLSVTRIYVMWQQRQSVTHIYVMWQQRLSVTTAICDRD